jgi:hypothetical protein
VPSTEEFRLRKRSKALSLRNKIYINAQKYLYKRHCLLPVVEKGRRTYSEFYKNIILQKIKIKKSYCYILMFKKI